MKDRTRLNLIMGILYPLETLVANFFVKQAVRFQLGPDYLGLQNVYTNFCDILTFAFAGIGIAMMFRLYKPIEEGDEIQVAKMFHFFDKVYRYFVFGAAGVGILFTGLVILSVKSDVIGVWEVVIGFLLYLISSLIYNRFYIYYFYLSAWQKRYAACLIHSLTDLLALSIEIGSLFVFRNYLIFLGTIILKNIVEAIVIYVYSNRKFPFLSDRSLRAERAETKGALRDAQHMIITKIGNLLVGSTDSILISGIVSTFAAGCYSSYYFLYLGLSTMTLSFYESIMNRVGKLLVTQTREEQFRYFITISFLNMAIAAFVVSGFFWLCDDFIVLWVGEELLLGREIVLLVSINLFMAISRHSVSIYRQSAGLFRKASWIILFWGILNLVLSVILGNFFGMFGILIATSITNFITIYWYEPYLVYRFFQKNFLLAFLYEFAALVVTVSTVYLTGLLMQRIPASNWLLLIVKTVVLILAASIWLFLIVYLPYRLFRKYRKEKAEEGTPFPKEKISVIVAVYNVAEYLAECLDSVLAQTYPNLEILVVDDGSEDKGGEICDRYAERDSRIRVIHQENQGLSAARNRGSEEATGDFLSFLDGDDILHPTYFETLLRNLKEADADVSVCGYRVFRRKEDFDSELVMPKAPAVIAGRDGVEQIVKDHVPKMIPAWGKLYCAGLKETLQYPVGRIHEDDFTTYKVYYNAERIAVSGDKLYGLRKRPGSITSGYNIRRLDKLDAFRECIGWLEERGEAELADYAKIRYILNLEIAWYNVNTKMKDAFETETELIFRHRKAMEEYWDAVRPLTGFADRCAVHAFRLNPKVYRAFARGYRILFGERG